MFSSFCFLAIVRACHALGGVVIGINVTGEKQVPYHPNGARAGRSRHPVGHRVDLSPPEKASGTATGPARIEPKWSDRAAEGGRWTLGSVTS
jgi:hypothetical protein